MSIPEDYEIYIKEVNEKETGRWRVDRGTKEKMSQANVKGERVTNEAKKVDFEGYFLRRNVEPSIFWSFGTTAHIENSKSPKRKEKSEEEILKEKGTHMLSGIEVKGIPGSRGPRAGKNSICVRQQGFPRTRSSRSEIPGVSSNWKSKENSQTYQEILEQEELSSHGKFQLARVMVGTSEFDASKRDDKRDERRVAEGLIDGTQNVELWISRNSQRITTPEIHHDH